MDSFDTHAKIPEHFARVDAVCRENHTVGIISAGWDPGLFSLNRLYGQAVLPDGADYTFWGKGVSQGHSDAIRRIPGVKDAKQYTIPVPSALERVRNGENPVLTTREKHTRECFVVAEEGADRSAIETAIKTMPNYFLIMIRPSILSMKRSCGKIIPEFLTAAWFSVPERRVLPENTGMSWNTGCSWIPTLNLHRAY